MTFVQKPQNFSTNLGIGNRWPSLIVNASFFEAGGPPVRVSSMRALNQPCLQQLGTGVLLGGDIEK